jgi:hypothetical protein
MKTLLCTLCLGLLIGCGGLLTRTQTVTPSLSTNTVTHDVVTIYTTNNIYDVNPSVTTGLNTASQIAGTLPTPWGGIAVGGLALVGIGLGVIAKVKSDKAALVPALITGIEAAANNADVKKSIQAVATASGLQDRLHSHVVDVTRHL